jgi:6-phosphofructokinase 1
MEVFGIERGYAGLLENKMRPLDMAGVSQILDRGGTILRTVRCKEYNSKEGVERAARILEKAGIDGLVTIGGDGTFMGARDLAAAGVHTVGIPGTIDNDLAYTEFSLGFDTAVNTALDAINKIRDTMNSHERISIIEVMGRHCGDIALYAGINGGAEAIIVPEHKITVEQLIDRLTKSRRAGKKSGIVVLAEGAGKAEDYVQALKCVKELEVRSSVLGHILRGGSPSAADRMLGSRMGARAVEVLIDGTKDGKSIGRIIGVKSGRIFDDDITEGLNKSKVFDLELYNLANIIAK